jgi:hypothetical protein
MLGFYLHLQHFHRTPGRRPYDRAGRRSRRNRRRFARSPARVKNRFCRRTDGPDVQDRQSLGDGLLRLRFEFRGLGRFRAVESLFYRLCVRAILDDEDSVRRALA